MPHQTFYNLPEDKRAAIVRAAVDEFAEHGYKAASINRIVAHSGIAKGSFYQYFSDKLDVFRHLLDILAQEKMAYFRSQHPPSPGQGLFAYFRWMIKTGVNFSSTNPGLVRAVTRVMLSEGMVYGQMFADVRRRSSEALKELIRAAKQNGEIDAGIDEDLAATVMDTWSNAISNHILDEGMTRPDLVEWVRSPETQKYIDDMLDIMEHGLRNVNRSSSGDDGKDPQ